MSYAILVISDDAVINFMTASDEELRCRFANRSSLSPALDSKLQKCIDQMARRDEYGPLPEKSRMWKLATGEFVTLWWAKTHQHRVDWYISKRCQVIAAGR